MKKKRATNHFVKEIGAAMPPELLCGTSKEDIKANYETEFTHIVLLKDEQEIQKRK